MSAVNHLRLHYHVAAKGDDRVTHTIPTAAAARMLRRQLQHNGDEVFVYECSTMDPTCPLRQANVITVEHTQYRVTGWTSTRTEEREHGRSDSECQPAGDSGSAR